MTSRILTLFTRTPLHVGAGASVGAIDQPIVRERHTGLPIIPGSSLKGVLADLWHADIITTESEEGKLKTSRDLTKDITWLFGSDDDKAASAGALSLGEARLLAFPIRSAKGSFAWITSPLLLARAARDGVPGIKVIAKDLTEKLDGKDGDSLAYFAATGPLSLPVANGAPKPRLVLEDYTLTHAGNLPDGLAPALAALAPDAAHFSGNLGDRLVIVSDGMMSFFARTSCEIAQHVRINDATGTAAEGGLFNQENVPADTLFYAVLHATKARSAHHRDAARSAEHTAPRAFDKLATRLADDDVKNTLQIGGDTTTGLGYCTATLLKP